MDGLDGYTLTLKPRTQISCFPFVHTANKKLPWNQFSHICIYQYLQIYFHMAYPQFAPFPKGPELWKVTLPETDPTHPGRVIFGSGVRKLMSLAFLSCFDSFWPKIAKKCALKKKKSHFVSQTSFACDIDTMTESKNQGFFKGILG